MTDAHAGATSEVAFTRSRRIEHKAERLLATGRLTLTRRLGDDIAATCHGDHGTYELGHDSTRNTWFCTCSSRGDCAHLAALWRVTVSVGRTEPHERGDAASSSR